MRVTSRMKGRTANAISASHQFIRSMMKTMPASTKTSSKMAKHAGGEHLVEGVDVGGEARDQAADGIAVEEADVHALHVAEDLAAQVEHDFLAGPLHQVGLDELQAEGHDQRCEIDAGNLRDAMSWHSGLSRRVNQLRCSFGRSVMYRSTATMVRIGAENVQSRLEQDGDKGNDGLPLVGPKVGDQTTHQAAVIGLSDNIIVFLGFLLRFFFRHDLISIFYGVPDAAGVTEDETCFTVWREYPPAWENGIDGYPNITIRSESTFRFRFAGRSAATATSLRVCIRQARFRDMWSGFADDLRSPAN